MHLAISYFKETHIYGRKVIDEELYHCKLMNTSKLIFSISYQLIIHKGLQYQKKLAQAQRSDLTCKRVNIIFGKLLK